MKHISILLVFVLTLYASNSPYNKGEMLYFTKACNGCHGVNAEGGGRTPRLANRTKKYLIQRLKYFKNAKVATIKQEMMVQFIINFSNEDIENIATFLSEHKKLQTRDVSEDLFGGYGS
ncbi:MAG: hypothetical protein DRG30_09425 [Epsilonproteobacteria bacterium]|nr:MAG: hypothetical protein DRG30_09425 [Campylobacterota bacterium]